ncbi:hypothetical protein Leryth_020814 [Lithospermum erythrorhizon]|nr:hypothetical protein Leryth_020814 [Lithospermum erythrorhizon]
MVELEVQKMPQVHSPCSSSRRRSNDSNSPEFEFLSFPQPDLHSADELFSGGVLLPLRHLHHHPIDQNNPSPPPPTPQDQETQPSQESSINGSSRPISQSGSGPVPELSALLSNLSASAFTSSKRWKDIFRKNDSKYSNHANNDVHDNNNDNNNNNNNNNSKEKVKEKVRKKEKRSVAFGGGGNGVAAELNINIWPFRRSRSAGNGGARPRVGSTALTSRKVSSAPCSRSNSAGESKSTKWPKSPSRNGVHLGRSSPIWQLRRTTAGGGGRRVSSQAHEEGIGRR